jgi:hypothetical protein
MGLITMFAMPLANYHATTQHSHGVITDFHSLHVFPCRANRRLTHIPCRNASPEDLHRDAVSGGD